jgi:hypothetical protein
MNTIENESWIEARELPHVRFREEFRVSPEIEIPKRIELRYSELTQASKEVIHPDIEASLFDLEQRISAQNTATQRAYSTLIHG